MVTLPIAFLGEIIVPSWIRRKKNPVHLASPTGAAFAPVESLFQ
jgi:hypothetical protein